MEKIIYPIWKKEADQQLFNEVILGTFLAELKSLDNVISAKACLVDEAVAPAAGNRIENMFQPAFDAVLMVWVNACTQREALENLLDKYFASFHAYLVTESEQLPPLPPMKPGERTPGMNQVVFLQKPASLEYEEWLNIWQNDHTRVAIETQSTFAYRQNVVVRKLSEGGLEMAAIVEEAFPDEAIADRDVFFAAKGDPEKKQQNENTMIESVMRFIEFDKIDCIPTSEYTLK